MPAASDADRPSPGPPLAVRLRGLEDRDLGDLLDLYAQPGVIAGTLQLPCRPEAFQRERLAQGRPGMHRIAAAVEQGGRERLVGLLGLQVEQAERRSHAGHLGMFVHDDFQGRGVGTALLVGAIELAFGWLGLERLELTVYTDNSRAIALYKRHGFVEEGRLARYARRPGGFADALLMARLREGAEGG